MAKGDDDLNTLFKSLGIDPATLGTAKDAKSSEDNPLVYMPGNGVNLVKQYNSLAKQASDLEYSLAGASYGSGASTGAQRSHLAKIQAEMRSIEAKMKSGDKGYDSLDYETARLLPTGWSPQKLKEFVNKGIMYGLPGFDIGMGMPEIVSAWDDLAKASATFSTAGKKWTPWDVMDTYGGKDQKFGTMTKGDWVFDVATGERLKYVGKTTRTSKSEQVNLSSPEEAQALITQTLREALGRAPNAEELAKFKASISGFEKAHPQVTTTTETATPESIAAAQASGGDVFTGANQKSSTSGGVSDAARAALVTAPTEDTKEYGKYQAATTYWDAMMQMIGGG